MTPHITDNDRDTITASLDGVALHSWSYETEAERRLKMKLARAFQDGWCACMDHSAKEVAS